MKEIIQLLSKIEQHACEIYQKASVKLSYNEKFSNFLSQLAEDEALHYHILDNAPIHFLEIESSTISEIIIDDTTTKMMEAPLLTLSDRIENNIVSEQDVVDCIVNVELSELNNIFLYIVNKFKHESREFQNVVATIQAHQDKIVNFLTSLPSEFKLSKEFYELPVIWENNILIVDDDKDLRDLIKSVLLKIGRIETAENGDKALEKVKEKYYNLIISDIDMPVMNGFEFFEIAKRTDPQLSQRLIFCSGNISDEKRRYFMKYNITHFQKPFDIFEFIEVIQKKISTT